MLKFSVISLILTVLANFWIAWLVFKKKKKDRVNIMFSLFAYCVAFWALTNIATQIIDTVEAGVFWSQISYFSAILVAFSFMLFIIVFPENNFTKIQIWLLSVYVATGALVSLWPGFLIETVELDPWKIVTKPTIIIYAILFSFMMVAGFAVSYLKYRKAEGVLRSQLQFIILGVLISTVLGAVLNLLLPITGHYELVWLGPSFSLIMVGFIAYSIAVHRLMDIKFVLRRSSVYIISLLTVFVLAISLRWSIEYFLMNYRPWFDLVILMSAITVFPGIKNLYYRLANKYFFSSLYNGQTVIADLSDKLRTTLEAKKIFNLIDLALNKSIHIKNFGVLGYEKEKNRYFVKYNRGFIVDPKEAFTGNIFLHNRFIRNNKPIVVNELESTIDKVDSKENQAVINILKKYQVELLVPMNVKNNTVGLLVLGQKESRDMYTDQDLQVLEIIGSQAAISIENALLYEETRNFNVKLQNEVEKATRDLRAANERLKKLDEAKSEFISIASHQLRTPLTVIKGYISMILEGSFGELTSGEQDSLSKVYESNERLIKLVENLLNISRIESGRLQFNYEVMQLEVLAASVFEELEKIAKGKKLKFKFVRSKKKLPPVRIDEEKVRQVILNLIDNAIKYTRKGSVTVSVGAADEGGVQVSVQDSGMGINPEDIDNLFKKFSRGSGTALVHTEGSGLGLYVAKQMVEAQGGRIWAESDGEGKGSRFCFVLPSV